MCGPALPVKLTADEKVGPTPAMAESANHLDRRRYCQHLSYFVENGVKQVLLR